MTLLDNVTQLISSNLWSLNRGISKFVTDLPSNYFSTGYKVLLTLNTNTPIVEFPPRMFNTSLPDITNQECVHIPYILCKKMTQDIGTPLNQLLRALIYTTNHSDIMIKIGNGDECLYVGDSFVLDHNMKPIFQVCHRYSFTKEQYYTPICVVIKIHSDVYNVTNPYYKAIANTILPKCLERSIILSFVGRSPYNSHEIAVSNTHIRVPVIAEINAEIGRELSLIEKPTNTFDSNEVSDIVANYLSSHDILQIL